MISMLTLPEDNLVFCIVTQNPECAVGTSFCHKGGDPGSDPWNILWNHSGTGWKIVSSSLSVYTAWGGRIQRKSKMVSEKVLSIVILTCLRNLANDLLSGLAGKGDCWPSFLKTIPWEDGLIFFLTPGVFFQLCDTCKVFLVTKFAT